MKYSMPDNARVIEDLSWILWKSIQGKTNMLWSIFWEKLNWNVEVAETLHGPALLITICICDVTLSSTHVEQTVLTVAINNTVKRFLLYINDIYRSSKNLTTLTCYLFTEGANLLYAGNNSQSLERNINTELRDVKFTNG